MSHDLEVLPRDEANKALVHHVHPPDWVNPQPAPRYNLVVVGAGTAGLVSAAGAAGLGARVALVERSLMGGDCLNVGCVPSKALLRSARACADVRDAGAFGVVCGAVAVDFGAIMTRMRNLRAQLSPHDSAERFKSLGVDVFLGHGRFSGPDTLEVAGKKLAFTRAVIATGAHADRPPIPGLDEAGFLTNETVFSLTRLPRRLAVIGAGPIGCELAQAFARFGSAVTLFGQHPQVLPREDPDVSAVLVRAFKRDGIDLRLAGPEITRVRLSGQDKVLHLHDGEEVRVDEVLVGVGRVANVDGLGLDAADVAYSPRGVQVDDRLRTTNPRIYAAGDVCSRFQFTHAADAMARIVLRNALFSGGGKVSSLTIPHCTYTDPEVAHVGLSEAEAGEKRVLIDTFEQELAHVDRAVLDGETEGFVKVHVRAGSDEIVGATIVARHAGEMIGELTLAMVGKVGLRTLAETIHPYPTQAEAIRKVADAYNRRRLTPFVKGLFRRWFSWGQ